MILTKSLNLIFGSHPNKSLALVASPIKRSTSVINGTFKDIDYKKDANSFEEIATNSLELNDIAKCTLSLDRKIAVDPYNDNRHTGSFIIIDRYTNNTVGAGMIIEATEFDSLDSYEGARQYTKTEVELNQFIRSNYPEWETKEIL